MHDRRQLERMLIFTKVVLTLFLLVLAIQATFSGKWDAFLACLPFGCILLPAYMGLFSWAARQKYPVAMMLLAFVPMPSTSEFIVTFFKEGPGPAVVKTSTMAGFWILLAVVGQLSCRKLPPKET